ncbi:hypothetical protein N7509_002307 [Penicillium cosmopolitanum]|uniref:Protein HRI1 n=1 Tax=Penicillium cosmopolitanum TaxID=1131564 RepID=A0A9W9W8U7_9EURO|nr:uncharacterized protein N7509_002307 [Penicillium cosmopolitanum]KAJ5408424.1 hypothetical protein N7509_002307 [Penicillium cosmopolitanum]
MATAAELGSTCAFTTRISLRWVPEPAEETTDTIVLSVGEYYLDLRMDKKTGGIDWAMAGTNIAENPNETPLKISFTRELDSLNEIGMVDVARFSPLPNGDDLEQGEMPHPDLPGAPMTAFEEVWRNLPFKEGPDGAKTGISWILESDDEHLTNSEQEGEVTVNKLFFGRIWGTYLGFHQIQTHSQQKSSDGGLSLKRTGSDVTARREEWTGAGWEEKYLVGPAADAVPSMKSGFEGEGKGSWRVPGEKVIVDGRSFIVRAFEEIA